MSDTTLPATTDRPSPANLTVREAAAILRVSHEQVAKFCRFGKLRHFRVGRRILIPREWLQEFIDNGGVL
jgi:excisionase family DNA binding protein